MVKGGVSFKKMGKGNKAKVKKYATVDFMQSCFYNLLEGLKIPSNSSGKAVLGYSSPNMDPSYPQKYTFYSQAAPTNHSKTSNLVFGQKGPKLAGTAGQRWWRRQGSTKLKTCSTKYSLEQYTHAKNGKATIDLQSWRGESRFSGSSFV